MFKKSSEEHVTRNGKDIHQKLKKEKANVPQKKSEQFCEFKGQVWGMSDNEFFFFYQLDI